MNSALLSAEEFVHGIGKHSPLILDTRSEREFERGHIPGAVSFPLLNNEHRHVVGTIYKKEGRQAAVLKGFELVGPLFHRMASEAIELAAGRPVFVYCWRGGMRSNIMAWLLQMSGLKVNLLKGGYKTYRHWVLEKLETPLTILILGGKTGSGKTEILSQLLEAGEQVIDLEYLASHKGSAFGLLGMPPQPSQEQFENLLASRISQLDLKREVWLENESRLIGKIILPENLFSAMREAPVVEVLVDRIQREERIGREYCIFPAGDLAEHTCRIRKRLGPQNEKQALGFLERGDKDSWLKIVLDYYDKTYEYGNTLRDPAKLFQVKYDWNESEVSLRKVINQKNKISFLNNRFA